MYNNTNRQSRSGSASRRGHASRRSEGGASHASRGGGYSRSSTGSGYSRTSSTGSHSRPSHAGGYRGSSSTGGGYRGSSSHSRGGDRGGSRFSGGGRRPSHGGRSGGGRGGRVQKTFDVSQFINKNPVVVETAEVFVPQHKFTDFGLNEKLAQTIISAGIVNPSPIQDKIIPHILEGKDVIGLANTGTGKTAAFLVPLIHKTLREDSRQTLILAPTRELAIQIQNELRIFSKEFRIFSTICVGGTSIRPQIQGLRKKNHFIIGTPGRVLDLIERGVLKPQHIKTVVLDEADRMLDMGFIHDMRKILSDIPKNHETLFFSATMSKEIEALVKDFLNDPVVVSVKQKDIVGSIEQDVIRHGNHDKFETLLKLLEDESFKRVIIFGAMKHSVEKLGNALNEKGIRAQSIHGNKSHPQRQRALKDFKDSQVRVLVATDVAARGIHVDNVTHVINYDLPSTYEDYVHRIGRTGRGSQKGKALTFIAE